MLYAREQYENKIYLLRSIHPQVKIEDPEWVLEERAKEQEAKRKLYDEMEADYLRKKAMGIEITVDYSKGKIMDFREIGQIKKELGG